jgi:hypothetical protein
LRLSLEDITSVTALISRPPFIDILPEIIEQGTGGGESIWDMVYTTTINS